MNKIEKGFNFTGLGYIIQMYRDVTGRKKTSGFAPRFIEKVKSENVVLTRDPAKAIVFKTTREARAAEKRLREDKNYFGLGLKHRYWTEEGYRCKIDIDKAMNYCGTSNANLYYEAKPGDDDKYYCQGCEKWATNYRATLMKGRLSVDLWLCRNCLAGFKRVCTVNNP